MVANNAQEVRTIFLNAIERIPGVERAEYLDCACGNNTHLRRKVETLLAAHQEAGEFFDPSAFGADAVQHQCSLTEVPGTVIGRYKLLEKIGEGGMAVVYMAEQQEPIHRKVALKIIKLGMDTRQVIARFEAERQALAMMDHPNIARVLDAGATETGRPYFVMELVTGVSITEYCDKNNLSTRDRLSLFIQVCNAVQHAHQKGIIHRDIKPTNVMVTPHEGTPVTKVIDFGIAKATNQRLTEKTLFTRYAHIIGTPAYMSPEQAELSDVDIDTRSDIYSLGALLYELLTGTAPFSEEELRKAGYVEMQRVIREEEPPKPSTRLSTLGMTLTDIAKHRASTADLLRKSVSGDLDWIVMTSLEKDRANRYETASELATDITRHLNDEPVSAGPPGLNYRMCKFARRHRVGVMTGISVAAGLLLAVIISILYAVDAEQARQETSDLLARSYIDRAQALCEQGEVGRGMLWLVESMRTAPAGSNDLDRAIRTSLAAWHDQLHSLNAVVQYPNQITEITFNTDGTLFLAACRDGTAWICGGATGQPIGSPLNHGSNVLEVAISHNGERIATWGMDGSLILWDADTQKPVGKQMKHRRTSSRGRMMLFNPDSSRLMTGGADGAIRLWDANTGKPLGKAFQYRGEGGARVLALACCPDGLRIVVALGRWDNPLHLYQMFDVDRGESIGPPIELTLKSNLVAISPDGKRFATAEAHSLIHVWEATTGRLVCEPIEHGGWIYALTFSPDGSRIVSGGNTCLTQLWDTTTGEPISGPLRQRSHVYSATFSQDGTRLVTGTKDGVIRLWDTIRDRCVGKPVTHEDKIIAAAYGPDGLWIVTKTNDAIQVRNAATGMSIGKPISHPEEITLIALSPDGSRLVTRKKRVGNIESIRLWNIATGELMGESSQWVSSVTFSPDGSCILTGGGGGRIWLLDASTLKCHWESRPHQKIVSSVAYNADGSQFLTGSYGGTVQLWDTTGLKPIGEPISYVSLVHALTFSPDGTKILIGFADGTVRLRDAVTLRPIGTHLQNVKMITSVVFSPDSLTFLACSSNGTARLWDTATLKPIGQALQYGDLWPKASFSPDGSEILLLDRYTAATPEVWQAPPGPLRGEYVRIISWVQVVTGMELDASDGINVLDVTTWQKRRELLQELGGPPKLILPGL